MTENNEEKPEDQDVEEEGGYEDDLQAYMSEMENLETDFSDLDDLDMEELKEMQEAIALVKEGGELPQSDAESPAEESIEEGVVVDEQAEYLEKREEMLGDFSDIEDMDIDELKDMKDAIEGVIQEEGGPEAETQTQQPVSAELEERIKEELRRKREKEEEE